jgi:hypothetical protein
MSVLPVLNVKVETVVLLKYYIFLAFHLTIYFPKHVINICYYLSKFVQPEIHKFLSSIFKYIDPRQYV